MILDRMENNPGARFLISLASLVVVVAGLRAAAPILVPFALALFLAVVSMPIMFHLRRRGVPSAFAIVVTVFIDTLVVGLFILLATNSVNSFADRWPRYQNALEAQFDDWSQLVTERMQALGVPGGELVTQELFNAEAVFSFVGSTIQVAASAFSVAFLVTIVMIFILAEATVFPYKFRAIVGPDREGNLRMAKTIEEVQVYLGIKTLISLATGIVAGLFCWALGLDFPILLGIIAFGLNFIPTIGSIIAAVPAMVIALLLFDWPRMVVTGIGYLVINTVFGNLVEPGLMGRRLGLSTLVVVLSLLFWGWVWGWIGALLSVPLTMVLKIVLQNTPDLRWIAILLDKNPPPAPLTPEDVAVPSPSATTSRTARADEGPTSAPGAAD